MSILNSTISARSAFLAATLTAASAMATPITITNGSFESPDYPAGQFGPGGLAESGFFYGSDVGIQNAGEAGGPTAGADGTQYVFVGNGTNFSNLGTDRANAGLDPTQYSSYTFTVSLAIRNFYQDGLFDERTANGTINVGIQDLTGDGNINVLTIDRLSALNYNAFQDFSVTLPSTTVAPGDTLRLFVDKVAGGRFDNAIVVENFRLEANPVPEPAMLGLSAVAALGLRRRRR